MESEKLDTMRCENMTVTFSYSEKGKTLEECLLSVLTQKMKIE